MEMTNCSLGEPDKGILDAIELWYESKRNKRGNVNRNVMAVGIGQPLGAPDVYSAYHS